MEKWFVLKKGADFNGIGERFEISPVLARLIRNREIKGDAEIEKYLNGSRKDLYDPHLFKDVEKLTDILTEKIANHAKIRIIGDYDTDGVMLWHGKRCESVEPNEEERKEMEDLLSEFMGDDDLTNE